FCRRSRSCCGARAPVDGRCRGMVWLGVSTYGFAALVYGAMTAILLVNHPGGHRANWLTLAIGVSALWAAAGAWLLVRGQPAVPASATIDGLHSLAWTGCVLAWLAPAERRQRL